MCSARRSKFGYLKPLRLANFPKCGVIYLIDLIYLLRHMNEFYNPGRHHEIIECMVLSALIDEHNITQGDIHKSENKSI